VVFFYKTYENFLKLFPNLHLNPPPPPPPPHPSLHSEGGTAAELLSMLVHAYYTVGIMYENVAKSAKLFYYYDGINW